MPRRVVVATVTCAALGAFLPAAHAMAASATTAGATADAVAAAAPTTPSATPPGARPAATTASSTARSSSSSAGRTSLPAPPAGAVASFGRYGSPGALAPMTPRSCPAPCRVASAPATGDVDAAPAVQAALDAAGPGAVVLLPAGTYLLSRPLRLPRAVTLAGAGMDRTTLLLDRRSWSAFSYTFLVMPAAAPGANAAGLADSTVVRDLTVNGNRANVRPGDGTPDGTANKGGGVQLGDHGTVLQVRLTNLNYMKVWINGVHDVRVESCRFDDLGGGASGQEDLVGGGRVEGATIIGNEVDASIRGNGLDLLRSVRVTVTGNRVWGSAGSQHSIYLEGVTESAVTENRLLASAISVQSDSGYQPTSPVINPRGVTVSDNLVLAAPAQGISVRYDTAGVGALQGGANAITGNTVEGSGVAGIIVFAAAPGLAVQPDRITGNRVVDAFARGSATWNCGYGTAAAAAIVVGVGEGVALGGNTVVDDRAAALLAYGVQVGISNSRGVTATISRTAADSVTGVVIAPTLGG